MAAQKVRANIISSKDLHGNYTEHMKLSYSVSDPSFVEVSI